MHPNEFICLHRSIHNPPFSFSVICVYFHAGKASEVSGCALVPFSDQTRCSKSNGGGNSAFSENLKKKKKIHCQPIWKIVNTKLLESLMSTLCNHSTLGQLNLLRFSELIFLWVNSDHCESTQLVNQLNLLWANSQLVESA